MNKICSLINGTFLCWSWPFFDFFLANISIFNLINIAIDRWDILSKYLKLFAKKVHQSMFYVFSKIWLTRYRAVCWPFSYNKENNLSTGLSSPRQRWKWEFQEFGFVFILWILIYTSLDFNYVKPQLDIQNFVLNFLIRGFDDLTLSFTNVNQNYVTMTKL